MNAPGRCTAPNNVSSLRQSRVAAVRRACRHTTESGVNNLFAPGSSRSITALLSLSARLAVATAAVALCPHLGAKDKKPELPAKVTQLIDVLFAAPRFERCELSPDGSHLAFTHEVGGLQVFDTYEFKTGSFRRLAGATGVNQKLQSHLDQSITNFCWIGPDQIVVYANEGNQFYSGLWITDGNLKTCRQLITYQKALFVTDPLPQNPDTALVGESPRSNFYGSLWHLDKKTQTIYEAEQNPGRIIGWQADVAGAVRLATVAEANSGRSYLYRDNEKKPWQPLPLPPASEVVTFDVSGRNLLIVHRGATGRRELQNFSLDTKQLDGRPIDDPVYDVSPSVITHCRTGTPVGLRYDTDKPVVFWLNPQYTRYADVFATSFPGHVVTSIDALENGDILFGIFSDTDPFAYYRYDSRKQEIKAVIVSQPEAARMKWAPMQPISFAARDDYILHGYLTLPLNRAPGRKLPLIALSHGGPYVRDSWGFQPEVQFLAALGYAVLQVNYRGSADLGRLHELDNTIEVAEKSVDDVVDGIRWAIANEDADPHRIVAYGGSYGGYISLGIATRYPEIPAAAVGFAGVYDWEKKYKEATNEWLKSDDLGRLFAWRADYYLDPRKNADRYRAVSPVHFAEKVRCPVLLHHGRIDKTVSINQTIAMASALRDADKSVELTKDPEGIHGLASERQSKEFYRTLSAFLLKYAPPDLAP